MATSPSDQELAAIIAAVEQVWPRPAPPVPTSGQAPGNWRWSGRWFSQSLRVAADRRRPM
jgi:hypothetical protein